MIATRQIYWNVNGTMWLYFFFVLALVIFCYGVYQRFKLWRNGKDRESKPEIWLGIKDVIVYAIGQKRILRKSFIGALHLAVFWGFAFMLFVTMMVLFQEYFNLPTFRGGMYLFVKFTANFFGLFALIGILTMFFRRYVWKAKGIDNKPDDLFVLLLLFLILVTGFLIQAARMAVLNDPWANWGFVGALLAIPLKALFTPVQLTIMHSWLWWIHAMLTMVFIGYFPYSKISHVLFAPLNIFFRDRKGIGFEAQIDFEDETGENIGIIYLSQLPWRSLLNADACVSCGRCRDNCPAYLSGKNLNPKQTLQDTKRLMEKPEKIYSQHMVGAVIKDEALWSCTTCRSCEEQCPVFVEQIDNFIGIRQHLVLAEARFPKEADKAFRNIENNFNPWGVGWAQREEFLVSRGAPTLKENPKAEILYWPGCSGALDPRNRKVSLAIMQLLQFAGVNFAILGNEEKCCGDSSRRLGNEFQYQILATENINTLQKYGVKKILTQCPHCFNILKNEYPQLGGHYEVIHYAVYLKELINTGKLQFGDSDTLSNKELTVTVHDSCYLGRYNHIYTEPRELLQGVGVTVLEMERHGAMSFCCGAGGGQMWLEEHEGKNINEMRVHQAIATRAAYIATVCPYCLTMLEDGVNARDDNARVKVFDIAEILAKAFVLQHNIETSNE